MPVLGGTSVLPPPPPPVVRSIAQPVPLQLTYIDPDGNSWFLSDPDGAQGYLCTDIVGLSGVPVSFSSLPLINGGAIPQLYIAQPRSIVMGLFACALGDAAGQDGYLGLLDSISLAFWNYRNDTPAPGTLIVGRPDGTSRQVSVICTAGADQPDDTTDTSGVLWTTYALTLQGCDPFFEDLAPQTFLFTATPSGSTGILPLLPVALAGTTTLGDTDITNTGAGDAYPVWTLTGPGTPTLTNNTTGRSFGLATALTTGQTVMVSTQPGQQSAIDTGTGDNMWSDLVQTSPRDLWALVPGVNDVNLAVAGDAAGTSIGLSFTRRWLRA